MRNINNTSQREDKELLKKAALEIFKIVKKNRIKSQDKLNVIKKEISKKLGLKKAPTNIEILQSLPAEKKKEYSLFTTKPTRTMSGVAVVAIMSYPYECPHGRCTTCPGGPKSNFGDVPQSYTGNEPATKRAIRNDFDPYLQVFNRLEQYVVINQVPEKIELIVMGGTFPSFPKIYQKQFITLALKAMNDFSKQFFNNKKLLKDKFNEFFELPGKVKDEAREKRIKSKILKIKKLNSKSLVREQKINETSLVRCVGMTMETRPDYANVEIGNFLLDLGCTRLELGIQSVYDDMLDKIERGHSVEDSITAIKTMKDLCFKLNFHYMLGLPGWTKKKDLDGMITLFANPNFRPDMLKLYPCMVLKGTKLHKQWKSSKFKPMTTTQAANLIYDFMKYVPEYCRIMRVQRDIPTMITEAGVDKTNLRQYIDNMNPDCRDIRSREAGQVFAKTGKTPKKIDIVIREYDASDGKEFFIAAEDVKQDILLGFSRLRFPSQQLRKEITKDSALIRELHVYGSQTSLGKKGNIQHKGYGSKLLRKAESIAKIAGKKKMIIISGIGVREYYRKFGYKKQGPYMVKKL
jgi:elongator complex protein 3